jgi:hypothetical protein
VVSSDWRLHATLEELGDYYISQGIIKRPVAVTDIFQDIFPKEWNAFRFRADLELERSMEINHWLENHPEVTHWVAVDDLNMSSEFLSKYFSDGESDKNHGLSNFVLTPKSSEGIKQSGIKEKKETPYVVSLQKPEVKDKVIVTVAGQHPSIVVLENETIFNLVIENKLSSNQAFKIFMEPSSLKFTSEQIEKILENDGIMDVEFDEGVYKYSI